MVRLKFNLSNIVSQWDYYVTSLGRKAFRFLIPSLDRDAELVLGTRSKRWEKVKKNEERWITFG
ncbi:MAG: hypothetical protein ACFFFC_17225 [Candidatus Thorarchaeota archaeon]